MFAISASIAHRDYNVTLDRPAKRISRGALVTCLSIASVSLGCINASADPITITISDKIPDKARSLPITDFMFQGVNSFTSQGQGAKMTNMTANPLKDLEITAPKGMTFSDKSSGDDVFKDKPVISNDGTMITFSGGNVGKRGSFFLAIPEGTYGPSAATPKVAKAKDKEEKSVPPEGKSDDPLTVNYNGAGTFSFDQAVMTSVEYQDGTVVTANNSTESIIGATINVSPMQITGPSPNLPGVLDLSDALLTVV